MSIGRLSGFLASHVGKRGNPSVSQLRNHFAELVLEPASQDSRIPFEWSDALRACILENDPINRVYDAIDRILSLESTPEGIRDELRRTTDEYRNVPMPSRRKKISDGTTSRACFRVVSYLLAMRLIDDAERFFRTTEDDFLSRKPDALWAENEFVALAKDLYTDLVILGGAEELREMFRDFKLP